jgi:hypothetical protein
MTHRSDVRRSTGEPHDEPRSTTEHPPERSADTGFVSESTGAGMEPWR